jgi:hypothetical protein
MNIHSDIGDSTFKKHKTAYNCILLFHEIKSSKILRLGLFKVINLPG